MLERVYGLPFPDAKALPIEALLERKFCLNERENAIINSCGARDREQLKDNSNGSGERSGLWTMLAFWGRFYAIAALQNPVKKRWPQKGDGVAGSEARHGIAA